MSLILCMGPYLLRSMLYTSPAAAATRASPPLKTPVYPFREKRAGALADGAQHQEAISSHLQKNADRFTLNVVHNAVNLIRQIMLEQEHALTHARNAIHLDRRERRMTSRYAEAELYQHLNLL